MKKNYFILPNILLGIVLSISFVMTLLPLTNVIGYEVSVINSILLFISAGISSVWFLRKYIGHNPFPLIIFRHRYFYISLLVLPLFISLFDNVFFGICPVDSGVLYYPVITFPAFMLGLATGYFSYWISKKYAYIYFFLLFAICVLIPIIEVYFLPQLYFYNPVIGFFPGTIYDEDIPIDMKFILYRLFWVVISFYAIKYLPIKGNKLKLRRRIIGGAIALSGVIFFLLKPSFGLATNTDRIENELNRKIETEHFEIFCSEKLTENEIHSQILHHEFYFEQLKEQLKFEPKMKIVSFVFDNREQKRRLFGAGNADVAKPWLCQIYTQRDSYDTSLKHEMAHAFSGEIGTTIFKVADGFNPAMIEGFAMALENNYNGNDIHYMASIAEQCGYKFPISQLFEGASFFGNVSSLSYISAGSFVKYIGDQYGFDKVAKLYSDLDFEKIIGRPVMELEAEYESFLGDNKTKVDSATAQLYFGRLPIFKKVCARYAANRLKEAYAKYHEERYSDAKEIFSEIYEYSGNYSSLLGLFRTLEKLGEDRKGMLILEKEIGKFEKSSYFFNLELRLADSYIKNNMPQNGRALLENLVLQKPNSYYTNLALTRLMLLEKGISETQKYLTGSYYDRYEMLKGYLESEEQFYLVPLLKNLSEALIENPKEFYSLLDNRINWERISDPEILMTVSKYMKDNLCLEEAFFTANLAVNRGNGKNNEEIFVENKKKIEWFSKFKEQIFSNVK